MSVTASRSAHTWAAAHRLLLAVVAVALAVAATVAIVLMTSSATSSSSSVEAPGRGQPVPSIPGPAEPRGPQQPSIPRHCLQHMGLQYMPAAVPC